MCGPVGHARREREAVAVGARHVDKPVVRQRARLGARDSVAQGARLGGRRGRVRHDHLQPTQPAAPRVPLHAVVVRDLQSVRHLVCASTQTEKRQQWGTSGRALKISPLCVCLLEKRGSRRGFRASSRSLPTMVLLQGVGYKPLHVMGQAVGFSSCRTTLSSSTSTANASVDARSDLRSAPVRRSLSISLQDRHQLPLRCKTRVYSLRIVSYSLSQYIARPPYDSSILAKARGQSRPDHVVRGGALALHGRGKAREAQRHSQTHDDRPARAQRRISARSS